MESIEKREKVCKFQRVFGIILILIGVLAIIVSIILLINLEANYASDQNELMFNVVSIIFEINLLKSIISLATIFILIGILFYTEGKK